jgi:hypothetical protein
LGEKRKTKIGEVFEDQRARIRGILFGWDYFLEIMDNLVAFRINHYRLTGGGDHTQHSVVRSRGFCILGKLFFSDFGCKIYARRQKKVPEALNFT